MAHCGAPTVPASPSAGGSARPLVMKSVAHRLWEQRPESLSFTQLSRSRHGLDSVPGMGNSSDQIMALMFLQRGVEEWLVNVVCKLFLEWVFYEQSAQAF